MASAGSSRFLSALKDAATRLGPMEGGVVTLADPGKGLSIAKAVRPLVVAIIPFAGLRAAIKTNDVQTLALYRAAAFSM
eukprot:CAMPEP_0184645074 /NCGR_PEP_ID=MMETSP0308-20130426/1632_1 /TAXON_ID=38269 /ORGANISM="Gloeochaete witrockiana, Strain SAG 46.84" /LENGTH=78 /DNA_ID=CAMNT_0027073883 /DNA_START=163 /DNA_END=399 /DNA_ORIENTATION=-